MGCRLNYLIIVLITISGVIFCEDAGAEETSSEESTREMRDFDQYGWRAVENYRDGDLGWIPRGDVRNPDQVRPKRRRLRKRKRRPPIADNSEEEVQFVRRRIRPYRLEPWEEINEEDIKPIIRRRKPQRFHSSEEINYSNNNKNEERIGVEEIRSEQEKPVETAIQVAEKNSDPLEDSKDNLKEPEAKLPAEQKNFKGNEATTKYRRLPPSVGLKKENKNLEPDDGQFYTLSEKETMEAQRKRFSLLQPKENKLYSNMIKYDVVTEATTERRIFLPVSSSKINELETTTEEKTFSSIGTTPRNRPKLPTTNAKLRVSTKKVLAVPEPIKISISEVTGFIPSTTTEKPDLIEKTDGPMRISIDLETMFQNGSVPYIVEINPVSTKPESTDYQNETYVTAKEEIMEIMEDPVDGEKLSRILENRNMTLEELVEQRERGSSQRHLADIFHNNTREPEPKEEPHVGRISLDFFDVKTTRQQKSAKFDEDSKITNETETTTPGEMLPPVAVKLENQGIETFPWKQLYPDLFPETSADFPDPAPAVNEIIERIENDNSYALNSVNDGFFLNIPSGVKSALFVSLAIIGLSIVVFLAILVVFKLVQKKNKSLNYCSNLTTRFKPPMIMPGRPTTAIKTFMNETLGRKKNYYKSSLQSMSDEIWDDNRERKESF